MLNFYLDAVRRHPTPLRSRCFSESWSTDSQDFVVQIAQLFGRYVQVRRLHGRPSWLECVMFCCDPDFRWSFFEVTAEVDPNGYIRLHGGNRIWVESTVGKLMDLFARNSGNAYARDTL